MDVVIQLLISFLIESTVSQMPLTMLVGQNYYRASEIPASPGSPILIEDRTGHLPPIEIPNHIVCTNLVV